MATIQQFKTIRASVSPEVQSEVYKLLIQDLDAAVQRMIEIGNENGVSFTVDEVRSYLREMDAEDEFDDIELDEATMAAVSGGAPWYSINNWGLSGRTFRGAAGS